MRSKHLEFECCKLKKKVANYKSKRTRTWQNLRRCEKITTLPSVLKFSESILTQKTYSFHPFKRTQKGDRRQTNIIYSHNIFSNMEY